MKHRIVLIAAVAALALLAACVSSGTTTVDPSIDARTLDIAGTWKVRSTGPSAHWTGKVELSKTNDGYTGHMVWGSQSYRVEQDFKVTVTRTTIVLAGYNVKKNFGGSYYPDTMVLSPASPDVLIGTVGDTGANQGNAKLWRHR